MFVNLLAPETTYHTINGTLSSFSSLYLFLFPKAPQ
jgi:hypothetical protein